MIATDTQNYSRDAYSTMTSIIRGFKRTCPHCGNDDTKKTIYLSEDSEMLKAYIDGEPFTNELVLSRWLTVYKF